MHVRAAGNRGPPFGGPLSGAAVNAGLREDDLDAAVLRLADTVGGRHAVVVLAAAADRHVAARDTEFRQSAGDRVGAALGETLVVARRAGAIGIPGDLDLHPAAGTIGIGRLLD